MKLQTKLMLFIVFLLVCVIIILSFLYQAMFSATLKEQMGQRALNVAESVAVSRTVIEGFQRENPSETIQPYVEQIRKKTGAQFITVGNREGIRYSHPLPDRIGKKMVGGDNEQALTGREHISEATGSLGPSIRGKAPVIDDQGKVIGIVSVGFLLKGIEEISQPYKVKIFLMGTLCLILGVIGSILIARRVKQEIHGLEPGQIGQLYQEKETILAAIKEGIIAVNEHGRITLVNSAAISLLKANNTGEIYGLPILEVLPESKLLEVIEKGEPQYDQEFIIQDHIVVANRIPIFNNRGRVIGAVSSFRIKSDLYRLTQELSQVKSYADSLRAQTHEYSNKLYLISGLIQLQSYEEALELIVKESDHHQNLIRFMMKNIPHPVIAGLLIGKFNRASELKIDFQVDRDSRFIDIPDLIAEQLITILGNVLDNAMDSVLENEPGERRVAVYLSDAGRQCLIEIEDNGPCISEDVEQRMFERGFSTKGNTGRGYGLDLVKRALNVLGGTLVYKPMDGGQKVFIISMPKQQSIWGEKHG
ncbi:two-component system, CitB family, sensor kinase [Fictibacillus solisalsi]|uniref:histidine kinase n=1 Tax=Fictibacillus solisalsi TaxID=459525 RepID=A0A1G9XN08_9BACL|nr:sensor histidine kinase [Fictibacillus solisalsi]SDM98148.1 two-component system, CitB family, sensor kinase [Fictibacillus solisalsi]